MSELRVEDWKLEAQPVVKLCRKKCDKSVSLSVLSRTSCERRSKIEKNFGFFAYGPLLNPSPSLSKITCKYNSMLTYIPVSFLFSFQKKRIGLGLKIGLGSG